MHNFQLQIEVINIYTMDDDLFVHLCMHGGSRSVTVGNELGAGNPKSAAFSVVVVTSITFFISVIAALVVLALRHAISYAFTEGEEVATAVSDLSPVLAFTLLLNGISPVLSGNY